MAAVGGWCVCVCVCVWGGGGGGAGGGWCRAINFRAVNLAETSTVI